jgi:hypothetical protein
MAMWGQVVQNRDSGEWDFAPAATGFARVGRFFELLFTLPVAIIFLLFVIAIEIKERALN